MDDPVPIPQRLTSRPRDPGTGQGPPAPDGFHDFDLDLQASPTCPEFRGVHVFRNFVSAEEADRIAAICQGLLAGGVSWIDKEGEKRC